MIEYATMSENGKSGWNRSAGNQPTAGRGAKSGVRSAKKVLCALCLVLFAVLGICIWLFSGGDEAPKREATKERGLIKEVTPAPARTNAVPVKKELTKEEKRLAEIADIEARYAGKEMPKGLATHLYYLKRPPKLHVGPRNPYAFLRHPSERQIAVLVNIEPGEEMLEAPEFSSAFNQDFINAMLDKIEISKDDSDEVRRLKEDVAAAKKEIARICKEEGRKPNEVLNEYAASLFELSRYAGNLDAMVSEANNNPNMTDADVRDYVVAANKLREQKGLAPLKIPSLRGRAKRLERQQRREAKRALEKTEGKESEK